MGAPSKSRKDEQAKALADKMVKILFHIVRQSADLKGRRWDRERVRESERESKGKRERYGDNEEEWERGRVRERNRGRERKRGRERE